MDIQSSQKGNDDNPSDKRKASDGTNVIQEQQKAVQRAMDYKIRSFRHEDVVIETSSGGAFTTKMWVSNEEPVGVAAKVAEVFKCQVCSKEFDKKQKLLLHARFHKS